MTCETTWLVVSQVLQFADYWFDGLTALKLLFYKGGFYEK